MGSELLAHNHAPLEVLVAALVLNLLDSLLGNMVLPPMSLKQNRGRADCESNSESAAGCASKV